jgi:hypothetical protein
MRYGDGSVVSADGPVLWYLDIEDDPDGRPRWTQAAHWVKSDQQMAIASQASTLLRALFEVATRRYVPSQSSRLLPLQLHDRPTVNDVLIGGGSGIVADHMSIPLLYNEIAKRT